MEGSINLITATGSVPLENYLTTVVGNVGSKFASAQFADDDCISFPSVSLVEFEWVSEVSSQQCETLPPFHLERSAKLHVRGCPPLPHGNQLTGGRGKKDGPIPPKTNESEMP